MDDLAVSVLIPVFNEGRTLETTIESIRNVLSSTAIIYEIVVVDDGCTDESCKALPALCEHESDLVLVTHDTNLGYGASLKTGLRNARHDKVLILDADLTYPVERIIDLVEASKKYDMVVGQRTGLGAHIPMVRRPAKAVLKWLAESLSGRSIPDLNSGFRVFSASEALEYVHLLPDGFSFTSTLTLLWLMSSRTIHYIPIDYFKRVGRSKIKPIRDTLNFFQLIIRTSLWFNPLRVFLPAGLLFIILGTILYIIRVVANPAFLLTTSLAFFIGIQLLIVGALADLIDKRLRRY